MDVRFLLITASTVLLLAGCRTDPRLQVYIDNMNAEKRLLEDTLFELQHDYDTQLEEVQKLRRELKTLKEGETDSSTPSRGPSSRTPSQRDVFPEIPELKPPVVDPGRRTQPKPAPKPRDLDDEDLQPPRLELGDESDEFSARPLPDDQQVTQLYIHPLVTGNPPADNARDAGGLRVVVEPRNAEQQYVALPGSVSVALLDPVDRSRIARWEFDRQQVELALQRARSGPGIELHLPWRSEPPASGRGLMVVRYRTSEGATVQQDREITIPPPGQLARWTPRADQRPLVRPVSTTDGSHASGPSSGEPTGSAQERTASGSPSADGSGSESRQARLPAWRPHR